MLGDNESELAIELTTASFSRLNPPPFPPRSSFAFLILSSCSFLRIASILLCIELSARGAATDPTLSPFFDNISTFLFASVSLFSNSFVALVLSISCFTRKATTELSIFSNCALFSSNSVILIVDSAFEMDCFIVV